MEILPYILVAMLATMLTRFLPYILLKKRSDHWVLIHLQKNMGLLIMIILVIYSLKFTNFEIYPYGFNQIFCVILALVLQIYTRNALLSILTPTIIYMILLKFL